MSRLNRLEEYIDNNPHAKKIDTMVKEVDLLSQRMDHCTKQIDSLRNKEFYQQTNETQLLDKINTNAQAQRQMKQQLT